LGMSGPSRMGLEESCLFLDAVMRADLPRTRMSIA